MMKQRITVEQLNELTEEQKEKLREWWKPQTGDLCYRTDTEWYAEEYDHGIIIDNIVHDVPSGDFSPWERLKDQYLPLLSIGQMIEFLKERTAGSYCVLMVALHTPVVVIPHHTKDQKYADVVTEMLKYVEMVDALWELVKQTLRRKQQ